ncbi:DNA-primase RepB domain-containing protein [Nitrosomonas communis]|uniref:RepB DNA-primase n=1 Tax=Nitrosomonas communis TaxID=44574 RepID=A0A1I4RJB7_9PROT|nr:DNA-primase RepB domain-containing protein [Nitrosomonas communis]SFM52146.1 RepB DNA-primase [Nitrosomonas communis]
MAPEKPKSPLLISQSDQKEVSAKDNVVSASSKTPAPSGVSQTKLMEADESENQQNTQEEIDPKTLVVPTAPPNQQLPPHPSEESMEHDEGEIAITNAEFVAAIFKATPEGAYAAVCSKPGDPTQGGWLAKRVDSAVAQLAAYHNNYFNCSSFYLGEDESFKARKERFAAYQCVVLDDVGTKVSLKRIENFKVSWKLETSPGNYQVGIILAKPITEGAEAESLLKALIGAGLCDPGASGPLTRWVRLPVGINGKPKYIDAAGKPSHCRLVKWQPDKRYTTEEIIEGLRLKSASSISLKKVATPANGEADGVLIPRAAENPVVSALIEHGRYKKPLGPGKHDITCPWVHEHTDGLDDGAAYIEPNERSPLGVFRCHHSHGDQYRIRQLLESLGITELEARHKPSVRVIAGELSRVIDAAEKVLADQGHYFQSGGLVVSIAIDPATRDPSIVPVSAGALTKELSIAANWEKYDGRVKDWVRCDPPTQHITILYHAGSYRYLPPLAGIVRQPYFRESDGELVLQPGYDAISQCFGVFDPNDYILPEPTLEAAKKALAQLEELLKEFHLVSNADKSAAIAAMITAVVRITLAYAPGFHNQAPIFGSGKTYLCELIGVFAGPAANIKVSYPTTSEEATKVILSLLLNNPAVIEFDDMDTDWIPHGIIKRMLTTDKITDRILGVSKTATVSTRTLFLGSGNNVGPVRDLLRRVLTIHLDPRCSTPATLSYSSHPVEKVRKNRGRYVSAVLSIIQAWRKAGSPRADVPSIATYSGAWLDYCRHPLIWLGYPDPATALIEQITHDPDADVLRELLLEWNHSFGSRPTTVRKVIEHIYDDNKGRNLKQALYELPVVDPKGNINRSKLGWFLKKNANRIIAGYEFQKCEADGRLAWRVVYVPSPGSPAPVKRRKDRYEEEDELLGSDRVSGAKSGENPEPDDGY